MNKEIVKEIFYCLSGALFMFLLFEFLSPNIILAYLNINLVLISWLIVGMIILVINERYKKNAVYQKRFRKKLTLIIIRHVLYSANVK